MDRRNFLGLGASSTAALLFSSLDTFSSTNKPAFTMNKNFELKILATNWGFAGTIDEYCSKVKRDGYDGIEIWWPAEKKDQDELFADLYPGRVQPAYAPWRLALVTVFQFMENLTDRQAADASDAQQFQHHWRYS